MEEKLMLENIKKYFFKFKAAIIFSGWIVGILVVGGLLWFFTEDFRDDRVIRTINAILINNNDDRRLQSGLPDDNTSGTFFQNYQRFSLLGSGGTVVVATAYHSSIPFVFAAFIDQNGNIYDILPLGNHSVQVMERIDQKNLDVYTIHIEEHEKQIRSEEQV
jgi:hypothetical protein